MAEWPRRGVKLSGRRDFLRGVGKAALMCFVAAARNSPRVQLREVAARPRLLRSVIGGEANLPVVDWHGPCRTQLVFAHSSRAGVVWAGSRNAAGF